MSELIVHVLPVWAVLWDEESIVPPVWVGEVSESIVPPVWVEEVSEPIVPSVWHPVWVGEVSDPLVAPIVRREEDSNLGRRSE